MEQPEPLSDGERLAAMSYSELFVLFDEAQDEMLHQYQQYVETEDLERSDHRELALEAAHMLSLLLTEVQRRSIAGEDR